MLYPLSYEGGGAIARPESVASRSAKASPHASGADLDYPRTSKVALKITGPLRTLTSTVSPLRR
jgi:hypothetical protein